MNDFIEHTGIIHRKRSRKFILETVCFRFIRIVAITCFIIAIIEGYILLGQTEAANGNETKVISPGGYTHLHSKAQNNGSVMIIVQVLVPFTPEPLLAEKEMLKQRAMASSIQGQIITELEDGGHKPSYVYNYKYVPYMAMTVDSKVLDALLSSPNVISVEEDIPVAPDLDLSVPRIGATELHTTNLTGAGVAVAVLDMGVDKTHPFLQGSVVSEACYSINQESGPTVLPLCPGGVSESTAEGSAMPYDGNCPIGMCSHGTHVAGIIAGRSGISESPGPGVAPEVNIIAIQVFSCFVSGSTCLIQSSPTSQMKALERVYELRNEYSIASVNMSLSGGKYDTYCNNHSLKPIIDNLRAAGIATVCSGGNSGLCGFLPSPACISSAISVGATNDSDELASYSNIASFMSILAPGSSIISSIPVADGGGYQNKSGTSMAAPHVAGAWALMKQAFPTASVDVILSALTSTGLGVTGQNCPSVTKRRINVKEAYNLMNTNTSL
jgi:subtilisin family serine protease